MASMTSTSTRSMTIPPITPEPSRGKLPTNTPSSVSETTVENNTTTTATSTSTPQREDSITLTLIQPSDWTFSTDYCLTAFFESLPDTLSLSAKERNEIYSLKQILRARELSNLAANNPSTPLLFPNQVCRIEAVTTSGINYEMLKRRDLPILFYDEIILYEVIEINSVVL